MKYFIYARKSTEEDDRQILSIEAQLCELREFATKEKLEIVASFHEAKTAKEPGRTVFGEMLALIEQGKADGILSWNPDRLARNSVDGGRIIHMIDRGLIKSLKFPTFWCEPTPQGLFMLNIAFGQSKYFVDNLRQNVKRGLRQKIRNGVWPGKAPVGYLNNPRTRGIDIDPTKAPQIREFFAQYATGNHTLNSLANWCKENKLLSSRGINIPIGRVYATLQNIFYLGLMKYNGEIFEGNHEPMISKKLFDQVQAVLKQKGKPRKDKKHYFDFLGMIKCTCGASITAEQKVKKSGKKYIYYRCTKKKGVCHESFVRDIGLLDQIKEHLQKVSLSSQDLEQVLKELDNEYAKDSQYNMGSVQNLKTELDQSKQQLEKLLDVLLAGMLSTEEYTAKKEKILTQKLTLQERIKDFEQKGKSWLEPAQEFVKMLNQAAKMIKTENKKEMATFLKNNGSNHILQNRRLVFSWQPPYNLVAESLKKFDIFGIVDYCTEHSNFLVGDLRRWFEYLLVLGG
ncbi:MAG: recombinase family protein [Patescibacteria group bacterium]|nr:recombinase family protein [Patescibacteria group bacterium]